MKIPTLYSDLTLTQITFVSIFGRFAVNFLYYGIKLNAGELKGDVYLNFFIIVSVEIIGSALVFVAGKTGRRPLYVINMVATSSICVTTLLISLFSSTCKCK